MGNQVGDLEVVTPLPGLTIADTLTMTADEANTRLLQFAALNGFTTTEFDDTLDLFRRAAAQPGVELVVPTVFSFTEMAAARRRHALMDAITTDSVAGDLACRATGASPDTRFEHSLRGDACKLTLACTNAL